MAFDPGDDGASAAGPVPVPAPAPAPAGESKVEAAKRAGRHLRGTISEALAADHPHFGHDDVQLLKFHGIYQQDDRDARRARQSDDKHWRFMARVGLPAGVLTGDQYLAFDRLADRVANGTLRVTSRQGLQFHGLLKGDLKPAIAGINQVLATTLAACGDVVRNVMGCPARLESRAHQAVQEQAWLLARALKPASRAYHEIWLDGERQPATGDEEPFYGEQYLPRKFKVAVGFASDNCVDLYAQDVALVALVEQDRVTGFDLLAGGGLGMTHSKGDTLAALAQPLGWVPPEAAVEAVRAVVSLHRDYGNRADRRHARLKYLLAAWGIERFRAELQSRVSFRLEPFVPLSTLEFKDHLGAHRQHDGRWSYGVFVQSGRIVDTPEVRLRTALRTAVERLRPGLAFTPHQNVLFTDLDRSGVATLEGLLLDHGLGLPEHLPPVRRYSMSCPALPTCGLAVAESERLLPTVLDQLETELDGLGLRDAGLTVRMTGCPNGCARPYTADLAFVGRSLHLYHVYVGGGLRGDRVTDLYLADVPVDQLVPAVLPLLRHWAAERRPAEGLGDFYQRAVGHTIPRIALTGRETPTAELVQLGMAR
jgi:sulfite reductase beta subunit-like hemoprotein